MKHILFPTDFSEVATNAFLYALKFADVIEADLIVLHSYDLIPMDSHFFPENFKMVYDSIELAHFDEFKDEIPKLRLLMEEQNLDHIKMTHRLMEGDLMTNMKKSIEEDQIDYIVMGTSGATEWEALFAGSNSGSVILGINVPVLCVPLGVKYRKIKEIGFISHYREKDKIALRTTLNLADILGAKTKSLCIKTSNSNIDVETIEKWEEDFSKESVRFSVVYSDEVKQEMVDFIADQVIDILTMVNYKSSFFEAMFIPDYSKKSNSDIDIPILIIHA
jgi:nucleotide-binding universal stress UspA family protein